MVSEDLAQESCREWRSEVRTSGSLPEVDLDKGSNGWSVPTVSDFNVRGKDYLVKKQKVKSAESLLTPLGVDWLRSQTRLDHVLARSDNRVMAVLRKDEGIKTFVFAVNLQVPGREHHSAVLYFAVEDGIPVGSLFYRFIHEDDAFRNSRFKLINRIVRGPWMVKAAVGNHAACLLGKALNCSYFKGWNYLEVDVDIGSSVVASALVNLALGHVRSVSVDMAFVVEAQAEEELPERILGAVRLTQIEMESALHLTVNADEGAKREEEKEKISSSSSSGLAWRKLCT